jgi:hypothetical protein
MDRNIVEAKLESLRRCVERIAEKTPPSAGHLIHDPDLPDIIALNLQRAVQTSVDLAAHLNSSPKQSPSAFKRPSFLLILHSKIESAPWLSLRSLTAQVNRF